MDKTIFEAVGYGEGEFQVLGSMATAFPGGRITKAVNHEELDRVLQELINLSTGNVPAPTIDTGEYDCRPDQCND